MNECFSESDQQNAMYLYKVSTLQCIVSYIHTYIHNNKNYKNKI